MLSEAEVHDLVAGLKRLAVEGASRAELPAIAGALRETEVALAVRFMRLPELEGRNEGDATTTVMTVQEVADELQVPRGTIYELCRTGELGNFRVGRHVRVRRRALDEYLKRVDKAVYRVYTRTSGRKRTPSRP